nr:hypothetical protein [Caulobacteraceae bacterium]
MTRSASKLGAFSPPPRTRLLMGVSLAALVVAVTSGEARAQSIGALQRAAGAQGLIPAAATAALA